MDLHKISVSNRPVVEKSGPLWIDRSSKVTEVEEISAVNINLGLRELRAAINVSRVSQESSQMKNISSM